MDLFVRQWFEVCRTRKGIIWNRAKSNAAAAPAATTKIIVILAIHSLQQRMLYTCCLCNVANKFASQGRFTTLKTIFYYAISLTWIILISELIKVCAHRTCVCVHSKYEYLFCTCVSVLVIIQHRFNDAENLTRCKKYLTFFDLLFTIEVKRAKYTRHFYLKWINVSSLPQKALLAFNAFKFKISIWNHSTDLIKLMKLNLIAWKCILDSN